MPKIIKERTCVRCGHGPYYPHNPESTKCPRCKGPWNKPLVRKPGGGRKPLNNQ